MRGGNVLTLLFTGRPSDALVAQVEDVFNALGFTQITCETYPIPANLKIPVAEASLDIKSTADSFIEHRAKFANALATLRRDLPDLGLMLFLAAPAWPIDLHLETPRSC